MEGLLAQLAEGDRSCYREIKRALWEVPSKLEAGDVYVTSFRSQIVWYEVLTSERPDCVAVRAYSPLLKSGEYDYVARAQLAARVARWLFERARCQGFRTVRAHN